MLPNHSLEIGKKAGLIRPNTLAIRPNLIAKNKLLRLRFTLKSLELGRILNRITYFDS